jgi:hypothetical protein
MPLPGSCADRTELDIVTAVFSKVSSRACVEVAAEVYYGIVSPVENLQIGLAPRGE